MEDSQIIRLYFARDEAAVEQTEEKYGSYCFRLARSILGSDQDAEEVVSDTYLHVWNAIPPARPQVLRLYLARITRNLSFSRWRTQAAEKRGGGQMDLVLEELSECIPGGQSPEEALDGKELAQSIRSFLDALPSRERAAFLRRYFYAQSTEQIASQLGVTGEAVRKSLYRTRKKLQHYLTKEGYSL